MKKFSNSVDILREDSCAQIWKKKLDQEIDEMMNGCSNNKRVRGQKE